MLPENCIYKNYVGFIPHRLNVEGRPELNDFPFNVLYVSYRRIKGIDFSGTALYEPELETFRVEEEANKLDYRNIYGSEDLLVITKTEKGWIGEKIIKKERVLFAEGPGWKMFFVHLTMSGLCNGEKCKFEKLSTLLI